MELLRKYISSPTSGSQPTGGETVQRLTERVRTSTLLDDRRDAMRGLKALSKKFSYEVGTQSMNDLIHVLETDRSDTEILGYTLDTLCNIMTNELPEDEAESERIIHEDLGGQFTDVYISKHENISLLLSLLEEYDFHVRWPTVKLLTILLSNRSRELQEFILICPMGVSKLMDLLSDSREIIRNDALLLLTQLTKGNANIQKIVAFENGFERLLDIVQEEGSSDGGIVVEDCMLLLLNLLTSNLSNQTFFKEGSFIQRLTSYFNLDSDATSVGWSAQKVTNIHLMLQLIRTLVSPNNPQQQTASSQKVMYTCGLLQQLSSILMTSGVPADVLTETINTVSEVIRGNQVNQEYFASVMAPSSPPRPAIVVLLMSMVNEKQPFVLRCAVLYCFQSFLYKNEIGQLQIVQTLLPTSTDVNSITAGQLLCGGLFSADSLSNWFAATALLHAILDNPKQKEQLLRVQLATSVGHPPVSLLQQCCNMLTQGTKIQTKIGLLMLISGWLSKCSLAVAYFLNNTTNVPFLITQISSVHGDDSEILVQGMCCFVLGMCILFSDDQSETFNKESLQRIIENRIGLETFHDKLQEVSKSEQYTKAAKKAHLSYKQSKEVLFDYVFTKLYKEYEYEMLKAIQPLTDDRDSSQQNMASIKDHENIIDSYKTLIKEQDIELQKLRNEMKELTEFKADSLKTNDDLQTQLQSIADQYALLKAQKGVSPYAGTCDDDKAVSDEKKPTDEAQLEHLNNQLGEKDILIGQLQLEISQLRSSSSSEDKENDPNTISVLQTTIAKLKEDLNEKLHLCTMRDQELASLQQQLDSAKNAPTSETANDNTMQDLHNQVQLITNGNNQLLKQKADLEMQLNKSSSSIEEHQKQITTLQSEKKTLEEDIETLRSEQDDLLVLLADQDATLSRYRARLKELGDQVDDDDDDDEGKDDEDEADS